MRSKREIDSDESYIDTELKIKKKKIQKLKE
jgi:hypothetical protein